jgi:hypothetical protein
MTTNIRIMVGVQRDFVRTDDDELTQFSGRGASQRSRCHLYPDVKLVPIFPCHSSRGSISRITSGVASVLMLFASPFMVSALIVGMHPTSGITWVSIDPGWIAYSAPALIAVGIGLIVSKSSYHKSN